MDKNKLLEEFEKSINRDKSKDIIKGNIVKNNSDYYEKMFIDIFFNKVKEFFIEYIDDMERNDKLKDNV
jgi:hypothetical protein|tara:strand:+ start:4117 stop:4323 length:207 start_codon:yes stop_codon:yes gene_type:complete